MGSYDTVSIQGCCTLIRWVGVVLKWCTNHFSKHKRTWINLTPFHNLTWFSCVVRLLSCVIEMSGHQIDEVLCNTWGQTKSSDKERGGSHRLIRAAREEMGEGNRLRQPGSVSVQNISINQSLHIQLSDMLTVCDRIMYVVLHVVRKWYLGSPSDFFIWNENYKKYWMKQ